MTLHERLARIAEDVAAVTATMAERGLKVPERKIIDGALRAIANAAQQMQARLTRTEQASAAAKLLTSAEHVFGACGKKARYGTLDAAGRAAERAHQNGSDDELRIYECPYCEGFHLTHLSLTQVANRTGAHELPEEQRGGAGRSATAINGDEGQNPGGASSARAATGTHRPRGTSARSDGHSLSGTIGARQAQRPPAQHED